MELTSVALSELLRQRRGALGITQAELARRAGVSVRTVRYLEQGQIRQPRTASIRQLLAALDQTRPQSRPSGLWIGVLGPLAVQRDGQAVALGDTRLACLLGLLALQANRPLSLASAVEALWGARPPASSADLVNRYVRRLRQLLGPQLRLAAVGHGCYQLDADSNQLDLLRFIELTAQARAAHESKDLRSAHGIYARALACWRGPALADQRSPVAASLSRQRLSATLAYADIGLLLGNHERSLAQLNAIRDDEPLHEGLHARLMLTLAVCGQQAAALELFDDLRDRLRAELNIEPGPEVRAAQLKVLRQEISPPTLGPVTGGNFVPLDVHDFVGREPEIHLLTDALRTAAGPRVHVISGMAGVGKTTMAVHLGHRLADQFPDGQLFVDLHTHSAEQGPLTPQEALDALLRQLGIDGHRIPDELDHSAALWRSLLTSRAILVVLDDAADAAQVRPLLPGGGTSCQFVITSRTRLTSLDAIHMLPLDVLPGPQAVDLFTRIAGPARIAGHVDAVNEVARLCGFLPLAIRIAAARFRDRPLWTIHQLLSLLRDQRHRLPALSIGDRGVGAALTLSYRYLTDTQQRLFRLLGDFPGADISQGSAAAIVGSDLEVTASLLEGLVDVHLLYPLAPDRYRLHDLIRDHARTTGHTEPADTRNEATLRTYAYYIHTAAHAADLLEPTRKRFSITSAPPDHPPTLTTTTDALAWFDTERVNIGAVVTAAAARGHHTQSWQLAQTLWRYFFIRGHLHLLIETHRTALACTLRLGNTEAEAEIRKSLGIGYWRVGRPGDAIDQHHHALTLDRANHDPWGEAKTHNHLGFIHARDGDHSKAIEHHHRSADLYQQTGDHCGEARALIGLGNLQYHTGRNSEGAKHFQQALELAQKVGDHWGEALASIGLGFTDSPSRARHHLNHGLTLTRAIGDHWGESMALTGLGMILADSNATDQAINHYRQAINLTQQVGDQWWERIATAGLTRLREHLKRPGGNGHLPTEHR